MSAAHRLVEVPAERLDGWLARFAQRHGLPSLSWSQGRLKLDCPDGAAAELEWPFPENSVLGLTDLSAAVPAFVQRTSLADEALIVLARRGGFAIGLTRAGAVVASKAGTRYVQGSTAAGGWSQKRYARRRAGQTDDLVRASVEAVERVLAHDDVAVQAVIVGGDAALIDRILEPARPRLAQAARSALFDVGDPRAATLQEALVRGRSIRIRLNDRA